VLGIDNNQAGQLAAETLIARGYTRVGFLGGPRAATSTQDRMAGFLDALRNHPEVSVTTSFADDYSFEAGRAEMLRLMDAPLAEAYFCGDDVLSIGVLSALQSRGMSAPDDVGIIGLNDMEMAGWDNINLTTIHNPISEIIASSVKLVADLVQDSSLQPEGRLFACHVVERGTLRPVQ
jgi:DNA-binding LacI/PurR family transcriptional regulator